MSDTGPVVLWYYNLYESPRDKTSEVTVHPAKTQISLGIRPVWSESSLCAEWVAKDLSFLHVNNEDSDQTGRIPRLILSLRWAHSHFVGFVMRRLIYTSNDILFLCYCNTTVETTVN